MSSVVNHHQLPTKISFSSYWSMRSCIGLGLPTKFFDRICGHQDFSLSGDGSILGMFFHELVRAVGDSLEKYGSHKAALPNEFKKTVESFQDRFQSVNLDYEPIVQDIYNTVSAHITFFETKDKTLVFEQELVTQDGSLFGKPDILSVSQNEISIFDLKLAKSIEKLRTQRNLAQLDFYAYLVEENYQLFPRTGTLIGLNGLEFQVDLHAERTREIVGDAKRVLEHLELISRSRLQLSEFATPNANICHHCKLKCHCKKAALEG